MDDRREEASHHGCAIPVKYYYGYTHMFYISLTPFVDSLHYHTEGVSAKYLGIICPTYRHDTKSLVERAYQGRLIMVHVQESELDYLIIERIVSFGCRQFYPYIILCESMHCTSSC